MLSGLLSHKKLHFKNYKILIESKLRYLIQITKQILHDIHMSYSNTFNKESFHLSLDVKHLNFLQVRLKS